MPEVGVIMKQAEHLNNEMVKNTFPNETWNMIVVGDSTKRFESLFRIFQNVTVTRVSAHSRYVIFEISSDDGNKKNQIF